MTKMLPNSGWCLPPIVHNLHWESFLPAPELLSPTPETSRFSVLMSQLCQSSASACVSVDLTQSLFCVFVCVCVCSCVSPCVSVNLTQSLFCGGKFCGCWLQCWPTLVGLFKQHMLALSSRSRQPDTKVFWREILKREKVQRQGSKSDSTVHHRHWNVVLIRTRGQPPQGVSQ